MSRAEMVRVRIDIERFREGLLMLGPQRHTATPEEAENHLALMGIFRDGDAWLAPRSQLWRLAGQYVVVGDE
jgi:hypothetical protein